MCNCLWWTELLRHRENVLRHKKRRVISNGSNSKVYTILAGQPLHGSHGLPSPEIAYVRARPNWKTNPVDLDIAGI